MIRYGELQHRDFLAPVWCKKLEEAGIDLSNSTYNIWKSDGTYFIDATHWDPVLKEDGMEFICHTATFADLLELSSKIADKNSANWLDWFSSVGNSSNEPELIIESIAFGIIQSIKHPNNKPNGHVNGNRCFLKDGSPAICIKTFNHVNETHPWKEKEMVIYWVDGDDNNPGYVGYELLENVTITDEHITDKSVFDFFNDQHLENWKEDAYYNFVNYEGIKI